ncbi:3-hydroxybutyryl-CoA dehydrogenase, partial [Amycolatopsis rubida]
MSALKDFTGRAARFAGLHLAYEVWRFIIAEVMATTDADPVVVDTFLAFAAGIGMVPIRKEKPRGTLVSVLGPSLCAVQDLAFGGSAELEVIDEVRRLGTGLPRGTFEIFGVVGLSAPCGIAWHGDEDQQRIAAWFKASYLGQG